MARILITGISGFTGRYLASALQLRGDDVFGIVREAGDGADVPGCARFVADLANKASLREVVEEVRPDRVVHLAAISFVAHGDAKSIYETNLIGTLNLMEVLVECGRPIDRVLLASSANVYGHSYSGQLSETMPAMPSNHYGVSKLAMEHLAEVLRPSLPITIVRPFNYTGVGQAPHFVIPKIVEHARQRRNAIELGNLDVARDFSDVRTVADCYVRLLDAPGAAGQTFNVCSGRGYTLRDVIEAVEQLAGLRFEVTVNPAFVRPNEIPALFGSRAKLEAEIGPIEGPGLVETLRWMLQS